MLESAFKFIFKELYYELVLILLTIGKSSYLAKAMLMVVVREITLP